MRWTASAPHEALIEPDRADFVLRGQVKAARGELVFEAVQRCEDGVQAYLERPREHESAGDVHPPLRLEIRPPQVAPVVVTQAWARATVPGQRSTAVYFNLLAPAGMRLVRAQTPLAPASGARLEQARLLGLTLRTRPIEWPLDLPAREWLRLKPGGPYLALVDLAIELKAGSELPLVLHFQDREGVMRQMVLKVPVHSPLSQQALSAIEPSKAMQALAPDAAAPFRSGARMAARP